MARSRIHSERIAALLMLLAVGSIALPAAAQPMCPGGEGYDVSHTVTVAPPPGSILGAVQADWFADAYAMAQVDGTITDRRVHETVPLPPSGTLLRTAGPAVVFNTCAVGNTEATVLSMNQNLVSVALHEFGSVTARIPTGINASAVAGSSGRVGVRGGARLRRGRMFWQSRVFLSAPLHGQRGAQTPPIMRDPIYMSWEDIRSGETRKGEALDIQLDSFEIDPVQGSLTWDQDRLQSRSSDFRFTIRMGNPWTVQQGLLWLEVRNHIVIRSLATGDFLGVSLPPEGSSGQQINVQIPNRITIDYDMGGSDDDDLNVQISLSGGGVGPDSDGRLPILGGGLFPKSSNYLTDLGTGHQEGNISQVESPSTTLGYNINALQSHVAENFTVPPGQTWQLNAMMIPLIDPGSGPNDPIQMATTRIWQGTPGLEGFVVAERPGDSLLRSFFAYDYRVLTDPTESQNAVKETWLDLSWVPLLGPGTYWIELGAQGVDPSVGPLAIPTARRRSDLDNARTADVQTGMWQPLLDPDTGEPVRLPIAIFGSNVQF